jgi:hypothetical protein
LRRTNSRCYRRTVSGLTKKTAQAGRGSLRLSAARSTRSPARQRGGPGLALEDAKLVPEEEYLGSEVGIRAAAVEEEIEEQAEEAVEESQEHDRASSQVQLLPRSAPDRTFCTPQSPAARLSRWGG